MLVRTQEGYIRLDSQLCRNDVEIFSVKQSISSVGLARTMLGFALARAEVTVILLMMAMRIVAELYHRRNGVPFLQFPARQRWRSLTNPKLSLSRALAARKRPPPPGGRLRNSFKRGCHRLDWFHGWHHRHSRLMKGTGRRTRNAEPAMVRQGLPGRQTGMTSGRPNCGRKR